MSYSVFIDGAAGTTGLQVADRLAERKDISLVRLDDERRKDSAARQAAMAAADITILCLPDDAATEAVQLAAETGSTVRLIDASSAHRIHPDFVYGFAEMARGQSEKIAAARLVSNPGCYPTGFIALVRPLTANGLLSTAARLGASCVSGYSGGGKAMIERYESGTAPAFGTYALGLNHKHLPEMQVHGLLDTPPVFLPSVGQFAQGMLVNILLHQRDFDIAVSASDILAAYQNSYDGCEVVSVGPQGALSGHGFLVAEALAGTDRLELFVFASPDNSAFVLTARLDNLGKGAAGAAVQNMNIMLGLDPLTGLNI